MRAEPVSLSRQAAIRWLREALIRLAGECSRCDRATGHGIYCLGFRQFSAEEFRRRVQALEASHPTATPEERSELRNRLEIAWQIVQRVSASCEAHRPGFDACHGWDLFSNEELRRLCSEVLHESVDIVEEGPSRLRT